MIKYHDIEQQTDEWFELRKLYPLSASNATAIKTGAVKTDVEKGGGLETLCWEYVADTYSDDEEDTEEKKWSGNKDSERGNKQESIILGVFSLETGINIKNTGTVTNDKYDKVCASPDGFTDDATVECKSFNKVKFLKIQAQQNTTGTFDIDNCHMAQMQQQMLVMEKEKAYYIVGNTHNTKKQYIWQEVPIDPGIQEKLKEGIKKGNARIEEIIKVLEY